MDRASYFIKDKALFGSFPTQEAVHELEALGVKFFINLTYHHERKITPYTTKYSRMYFPIIDRNTPDNRSEFACFILTLKDIIYSLKSGELLYIHCKGGHGRSGIVVSVLLSYLFNLTPDVAIKYTTTYHSNRKIMKEKWRKLGSPQTFKQKKFVRDFCSTINFYRAYTTGYTAGFSNFTNHDVTIPGFGTFPTAEAAIQAYKLPDNIEYVKNQENARAPIISKNLGRKIRVRKDWNTVSGDLMFKVLLCKFNQHAELKKNLINTGLGNIVQHTRGDSYWGDGGDGTGSNILGKQLTKLREFYYRENNKAAAPDVPIMG